MKTILTLLLAALALATQAQPQKINYQAIALGSNGKPLKNTAVSLRLSVLDSAATGTVLYTETQPATTDAGGQFSVYLGTGTPTAGTFANLPWANGNDKFLKVEMDAQGGTNYQVMGTTQLVSVPYAMAAGTANVIEEGTIMKMKNGHIYRLDYPSGNGPVWNAVGGITQANISMDTIFSCSDSVWLYGNKLKSQEYQEWQVIFPISQMGMHNSNDDSIQVFRTWGDTLAFNYYIFPTGSYGNGGFSLDKVVVIFLPKLTQASAGPDQLSLIGTTATLAANAPAAGETGTWTITTGSGATLNNANSPTATFTKGTDSSYTLVWTITGPCGTSRDTVNISFQNVVMNVPCPGVASITCAGESYPTVQIGTQCWLAKNLNIGTMINGGNDQTNNSTVEKYCFSNDSANCITYGGLYQWAEAVQYQNGSSNTTSPNPAFTGNVRGICPTDWHLPSDAEWGTLETFLGGSSVAGGALKSTSGLWISPNNGATNSSGFSVLPSGYRNTDGAFGYIGGNSYFWSSSESSSTNAIYRDLYNFNSLINRYGNTKRYGLSVRCIKDSCAPTEAKINFIGFQGFDIAMFKANSPGPNESGRWIINSGYFNEPSIRSFGSEILLRDTDDSTKIYEIVWEISGVCGVSTDTLKFKFPQRDMNRPCTNLPSMTIQGQVYPTVQIGNQCWLSKNLNIGTLIISNSVADSQRNNQIIEKYCYNNDTNSCNATGGLYQWEEANNYFSGKDICPTGWHVANTGDWSYLDQYLAYGNCCSGERIWPQTVVYNNLYYGGFSPQGGDFYRDPTGNFVSGYSDEMRFHEGIFFNSMKMYSLYPNGGIWTPDWALPIRCVKD